MEIEKEAFNDKHKEIEKIIKEYDPTNNPCYKEIIEKFEEYKEEYIEEKVVSEHNEIY